MLALVSIVASLARVVGGSAVAPGEFPDVVLVAGWTGLCSGTLIAPDVVLTAGHCTEIDPQAVLVGSVDYGAPAGDLVPIASVTAYPDWQHAFDVAVVVLAKPVEAVAPRPIASGCGPHDGDDARVIGFGLDDPGGSGASTALETAIVAIDDAECTTDPACRAALAPGGELVAGGRGVAACYGDSGGPLLADTADGGEALFGVVSRATDGSAGAPCSGATVYERADGDAIVAWIEATTGRTVARAPCATALDADAPGGGCAVCSESGLVGAAVPLVTVMLAGVLRRRRRA
ncbi:MAG TPA: trypsin-like serine protease [Kofleriaceae bacterium]|jgi:hypothetical protein